MVLVQVNKTFRTKVLSVVVTDITVKINVYKLSMVEFNYPHMLKLGIDCLTSGYYRYVDFHKNEDIFFFGDLT